MAIVRRPPRSDDRGGGGALCNGLCICVQGALCHRISSIVPIEEDRGDTFAKRRREKSDERSTGRIGRRTVCSRRRKGGASLSLPIPMFVSKHRYCATGNPTRRALIYESRASRRERSPAASSRKSRDSGDSSATFRRDDPSPSCTKLFQMKLPGNSRAADINGI